MKRRILAVLASLFMVLGMTMAATPVAQAAYCRYLYKYDSVQTDYGQYKTVTIRLYTCDHGSYERLGNIRFTWPSGTTYIRKLYDSGSGDTNIRMRCGTSSWTTIKNNANYYNGTSYALDKNCSDSNFAYVQIDLTPDTVWWIDTDVYQTFNLN